MAICGVGVIAPNMTQTALNIAATWIFPLAILLNLPYEGGFKKEFWARFRTILASVSNWLGSPQTSLAASVWNFHQIESCQSRVRNILQWLPGKTGGEEYDQTLLDAMYVMTCFNQFSLRPKAEIPAGEGAELVDLGVGSEDTLLLRTLIYGVFRPISAPPATAPAPAPAAEPRPETPTEQRYHPKFRIQGPEWSPENEQRITRNLINTLAHKLRMHRRRGVVPTLANMAVFLLAYIFSIILAFSDLSESTTLFVLDLALLFSWLPVLVVFTIVDRNPVSSKHQA